MDRPTASYRTDLILTLLGIWFTVGLFLDAWAHNNVPNLETFFTPWHAVFYAGFSATAGWVLWTCRRALHNGQNPLRAIPIGYGPTVIAVIGFAVAAFGDLVWHTVFGVEQAITILFSPTHLAIITAMITILTTPIRSIGADATVSDTPGLRRLLPVVASTAFAATLILLFLQYSNAFTYSSRTINRALTYSDGRLTAGLAGAAAMTGLVLTVPLLLLARRWRPPFGTATIIYLAVGGLSAAITGLSNLTLITGVVVAGVCVDLLAVVLRPAPDRPDRLRWFGLAAPLITWTIVVVTAWLTAPTDAVATAHPESRLELTTGLPVVQALLGLLAAILLTPTAPRRADA